MKIVPQLIKKTFIKEILKKKDHYSVEIRGLDPPPPNSVTKKTKGKKTHLSNPVFYKQKKKFHNQKQTFLNRLNKNQNLTLSNHKGEDYQILYNKIEEK